MKNRITMDGPGAAYVAEWTRQVCETHYDRRGEYKRLRSATRISPILRFWEWVKSL